MTQHTITYDDVGKPVDDLIAEKIAAAMKPESVSRTVPSDGELRSIWRDIIRHTRGEGHFVTVMRDLLSRYGQPAASPEPAGWREFIENIATPRSEPLNSVSAYRDNASRRSAMGELRRKAQELLHAAPVAAQAQPDNAVELLEMPDREDICDAFVSACDADGIKYDPAAFEAGYLAGEADGDDSSQAQPARPFQGTVERHSDQSVLVSFPSCHLASEFQRNVAAQAQPVVNQSLTDEREAFEGHFEYTLATKDGGYIHNDDQCRWEGWQARAALAQRPSAQAKDIEDAHWIADHLNGSDPGAGPVEAMHECIDRLAAQVQQPSVQDHEDAERYRWLRDQPKNETLRGLLDVVKWESDWDGDSLRGLDLDAAIDAARAAKEE